MTKFLKTISMTLLVAALTAIMAACGDATPTSAPANNASNGTAATTAASSDFFVVSGATSTSVPDALKAALSQYEAQYPGSKAQAFKTSAQASTIKDQLAGAFTKEGWQNVTPNVPDSAGGFALAFTKGNKGAAVVGFPGMMANLAQNENLYIVFLPQ